MIWQKTFTKHCTDVARSAHSRMRYLGALTLSAWLAGCGLMPSSDSPTKPSGQGDVSGSRAGDSVKAESQANVVSKKPVKLGAPTKQKHWQGVREQAAKRLVDANPHMSYRGEVPDVLLAIPVLSIDLNADGSVRRIEVMRHPSQAKDTVKLAIQAIHNAAPFGDVSHLPKPWRFSETFLFNDDRHFKPMTLDRR